MSRILDFDDGFETNTPSTSQTIPASDITNTPSGNVSSTDIQSAINELQVDIDTRLVSSDLVTHENDTSTHGVSGSIVGTTDIQTLTNKTLTAPVINSPSGLVKADVGLSNVDNTSDATKNATSATLTNKTLTSPVINSPTGLVKADVGLGNVDNTSDSTKNSATATLTNKTISGVSNTITNVPLATAVSGTLPIANGGTNNGSLATTAGGMLYTDGTKVVNIGVGTSYQTLQSNGSSAPTWVSKNYYTLEQFGGAGDNSTDNTAAFNSFLSAAAASSNKELYLLGGSYRFNSAPNDIATTINIRGTGKSTSVLVRNFNPSSGVTNGLLNFRAGSAGSVISGFSVISLTGQTNGSLISLVAGTTLAPDFMLIQNINLSTSGTNTHQVTFAVDGSARTASPIGVRDLTLVGCTIFGGSSGAVNLKSTVGVVFEGCGIFPAGGSFGTISLDGIVGVLTQYVRMSLYTCNNISFSNCLDVNIDAGSIQGNITNASSASSCVVTAGSVSGTVSANWVNSVLKTPVQASFLATNTAATSLGNGPTDIPFTNELYDDGGVYSSPTFTVPTGGDDIYYINTKISFNGIINSAQYAQLDLVAGGSTYTIDVLTADQAGSRTYTLQGSIPLKLVAGNTAKLQLLTNTAGNMVLNSSPNTCFFSITKRG